MADSSTPEPSPISRREAESHLRELRRARAGWVKILERSNYADVEALSMLISISGRIDGIKGLFPFGTFGVGEPLVSKSDKRHS